MNPSPVITQEMDPATFRSYYYYKEELVAFCRQQGLHLSGGKLELTDRIAHYLETGEKMSSTRVPAPRPPALGTLTTQTLIESPFICSEKHRAFFKAAIGPRFSFPVAFQTWLKEHAGMTYQDAIDAYFQILADKKNGASTIDKQFEYNTYIRDFFADNPGKKLSEAILCWKEKKAQPGHHRYERADLAALEHTRSEAAAAEPR